MRASTLCFVAGTSLALLLGSALVAQGGLFGSTPEVEMQSAETWDDPGLGDTSQDEVETSPGPEDWMLRYGFPLAAGLIVAGAVLRLADLRRVGP